MPGIFIYISVALKKKNLNIFFFLPRHFGACAGKIKKKRLGKIFIPMARQAGPNGTTMAFKKILFSFSPEVNPSIAHTEI
jgi:hypothetical protein